MEKKPMGKKTALAVLGAVIVLAVLLGLLLMNKGDGPVTGMLLTDRVVASAQAYSDAAKKQGDGVYLVVSNAFNQFQEDYKAAIPEGRDLYATVYFVECPQGSTFTGKWVKEGHVIQEEKGTLPTGPQGIISYLLGGENATAGIYTFELYDGDQKIFEKTFQIG